MNNQDDIFALREHFLDYFPDGIRVVFDNEPNTAEPDETWVRLSVQPGLERRRSIASRSYEQLGRIYLQVFVPESFADGAGWTIANAFADNFRDWSSDDFRIRCATPEFRTSDAEEDYFMILVSIPYTAQH